MRLKQSAGQPKITRHGKSRVQMNYTSLRYLALVSLTSLLAFSTYCLGQSMAMPAKDQPIRTVVYLVLINVLAEDRETHAPVQDLSYSDFQIFDNGSLLEPSVFVSGSSDTSRPLAIWFLVGCPEKGQGQSGSGPSFTVGSTGALKQALASLDSASTVGVAHWCANGDASADLLPTQDHDASLDALEAVHHQAPVEPSKSSGGRALQRALDLVMEKTHEALPVIVLLYDGSMDVSRDDAELMAKKLLYHGAILYQAETRNKYTNEERSPFQIISHRTGGRVYSVQHEDYFQAMNSIMKALRFRYTLGVIPRNVDGQWHEIRVQLTEAALHKHKPVRVDYSTGYLAVNSFGAAPPYSKSNYRRSTGSNLDTILTNVLDSPTLTHDILFDVNGHGFIGSDHLVELSLRLPPDQLTWDKMPNGDRRSEVNIVVAGYSDEGKKIGHELVQFEIVRDEVHLPITGDGPFSSSETVVLPENTSRVRVAVRDVATGKLGCQDLSLKEILSAPRSRMVIR